MSKKRPDNPPQVDTHVTTYIYDAESRIATVIDAVDDSGWVCYDGLGLPD